MSDAYDKDIRELRTEVDDVKEEVHSLNGEIKLVKKDVADIKSNVTNHIPTQIRELSARLTPFEKRYLKFSGVQEFLTTVLKVSATAAAVTWTVIKIVDTVSKYVS